MLVGACNKSFAAAPKIDALSLNALPKSVKVPILEELGVK